MTENNTNECCCTTPEYTIRLSQQGPQGLTGEPGADGYSPQIEVYEDTNSSYKLSITTAEGNYITPNLKGDSVPTGGFTGQVLTKNSNDNLDTSWQDLPMATDTTAGMIETATLEEAQAYDEDTAVTPYILSQVAILSGDVRLAVLMNSQTSYDNTSPKIATTLYLIPEEEED